MSLVDSHAHLDFVDNLDGGITRAKSAGVSKIVSVGTTVEESRRIIELAEKYSDDNLKIFTTVGIHPKDGKEEIDKLGLLQCVKTLKQTAQSSDKVVAIGECGLDYYLGDRVKSLEIRDKDRKYQKELFEAQVELGAELDLPIVVHCRNGWEEIFNILKKSDSHSSNTSTSLSVYSMRSLTDSSRSRSNSKLRGVFHSWTGDWDAAKKALELGFYISFSGIVTFKNAPDVQDVAKKAPLERILVETDSPFLSPEPLRGRKNSPENVKIVAQFIANLRNLPFGKIASATSKNAADLFGLK